MKEKLKILFFQVYRRISGLNRLLWIRQFKILFN
jgi:hypothetical protein